MLHKNCLRKPLIDGKVKITIKRGRRRKKLLDDLEETRTCFKFKEEAPDGTLWRGYRLVVGPTIL